MVILKRSNSGFNPSLIPDTRFVFIQLKDEVWLFIGLSPPVEGLRQFISCMLDLGIHPNDVRTMVKTNPEKLLGLEPKENNTFKVSN